MTKELESRKDLVDEKATRHDNGCGTIHTPCGAKGEGACHKNSDTPQSLIHDKNLTSYRLNVLTTYVNHFTHLTHLTHFTHLRKRFAFTLAEVLITLGVIGIVAAMTIPNLVQSYKKKLVETRLVHFYSTINQAFQLSEVDNGKASTWEIIPFDDLEQRVKWFEKYLFPYFKYGKIVRTGGKDVVLDIYLLDGSTLRTYKNYGDWQYYPLGWYSGLPYILGKTAFVFTFDPLGYQAWNVYAKGKLVVPYSPNWDGTLETAKENCDKGNGRFCVNWIMLNGWKIPEDYPFKF